MENAAHSQDSGKGRRLAAGRSAADGRSVHQTVDARSGGRSLRARPFACPYSFGLGTEKVAARYASKNGRRSQGGSCGLVSPQQIEGTRELGRTNFGETPGRMMRGQQQEL